MSLSCHKPRCGLGYGVALFLTAALMTIACTASSRAQDSREALGVGTTVQAAGPHPLLAIEAQHPATLKPELLNVHPRVFFTTAELGALQTRSQTTHKALWEHALSTMLCLQEEPAPPPAQQRRAQNDVGLAIGESAFAYSVTRDPKFLALAKKFMDAAVSYDIWGYASSKPNVDLAAGHLLYGMGMGYDLLYNDLTEAERARYREKIARQGHLMFEYFKLKPGKTFSYSQNHLFIPAAGLGVAAYAVYGEVPEAADWAKIVRALYDRVLSTYSVDGYYYEGFEYWVFSTPWIVHYLDALAHATGEDLYDQPGLKNAYKYVSQEMLPDGQNVFDFGDVFSGPLTRSGKAEEFQRTHPGGKLHSNYHLLYRFAQRFHSGEAQGVADWLASLGQNNFEDYWSLAWYDPSLAPVPIQQQPTMQHFADVDVVIWRSGWDRNATALAFKCGPPDGHKAAELISQIPDWHREEGHAHPDANAFILYANGQYLTGVCGYAGVPMTDQSNTLLIDGKGQANEGSGHNAFLNYPYDRLNQTRIVSADGDANHLSIVADATGSYAPSTGLQSFVRRLELRDHELQIVDTVQTDKAATSTILFHFDGDAPPSGLKINVDQPGGAVQQLAPMSVTAPGPPGAVDKGVEERRGSVLRVSVPALTQQAQFKTRLTW